MNFDDLCEQLPLGHQTFSEIRQGGMIYVDKTDLLYSITKYRQPIFISRPRRFGKSTIVSTFEELFAHGVDPYDGHDSYFKGLAIEKLWRGNPRNNGPFYILHLDFDALNSGCRNAEDFRRQLNGALWSYAEKFKIKLDPVLKNSPLLFDFLMDGLPNDSAVLLIDEYDSPLTANINSSDDADFNAAAEVLRDLFKAIKRKSRNFRFVFITGITRFKDSSIFTAGSTIKDLSQDPRFGTLCGITRAELRQYFTAHLRFAAANVYVKAETAVTDEDLENLLDKLAQWYDGCCFDEECSTHVYSTWSVLNFFCDFKSKFKSYWYDSGGLPTVLRKSLFQNDWAKSLEQAAADFAVRVKAVDFKNPATLSTMNRMVLLFQTGYLSIKAPYEGDNASAFVSLGLPNFEMKEAIRSLISSEFLKIDDDKFLPKTGIDLCKAIQDQDLKLLLDSFNAALQSIDYDHYFLTEESAVAAFLKYLISLSLGIRVPTNLHEARGRSDILFDYADTTVVIELKYLTESSQAAADAKLKEALAQIRDRRYGQSLESQPRLWRLAMVFSGPERCIVSAAAADDQ